MQMHQGVVVNQESQKCAEAGYIWLPDSGQKTGGLFSSYPIVNFPEASAGHYWRTNVGLNAPVVWHIRVLLILPWMILRTWTFQLWGAIARVNSSYIGKICLPFWKPDFAATETTWAWSERHLAGLLVNLEFILLQGPAHNYSHFLAVQWVFHQGLPGSLSLSSPHQSLEGLFKETAAPPPPAPLPLHISFWTAVP